MRIEPASEAAAPARLGVCLSRSPTTIEYSPIFDPLPPDFKRLDVPMAKQLWLTGLRGMTLMVPGFARGRTRGSSARSRDTRAKILAAACAVWLLAPPFAYAQFPFWPQRGFWPGQYGGHGHKHHHRHTKPELTKKLDPRRLQPIRWRSSSRSPTSGCRCMRMARWLRALRYPPGPSVIRHLLAFSAYSKSNVGTVPISIAALPCPICSALPGRGSHCTQVSCLDIPRHTVAYV